MATLEKIDGFEHGNPSTGTNGIYDVGASTQVAVTFSTGTVRTGLRSLQCEAPSADTCNVGYTIAGNVVSSSFYIRIATALPNNNAYIAAFTNATSGGANIQYGTGTTKFNLGGANFTGRVDFGPALAIDTWYRIDVEYDTSATPAVIRAQVDGANEGTHTSNAITPANSTEIRLGATTSSTWGGQHFYDDWVISLTDGDYPLGEYQIESLIPSSDGTHNISTSGDFDSFTGTAFSNSTTNGNTFIGHRPQQKANTADQVIRQELGTTSNYMEFGLENHTLSGTPAAGRCYACYVESAASGASLAEQRLYLADGTTEVLSTGSLAAGKDTGTDPGTTVATAKRMLIAPSGGWDNTKIDGLLARMGYGDNAPDVNFIDFMLEFAYFQESAPTLVINDATHAHAADNLVLTQDHFLTVQDALHGHAAENLALTQDHTLVIQDALHGHTAENLVLETSSEVTLVIQDAIHAHAADGLALTQDHFLTIQDALHGHTADNLALTQDHFLVIQDALHGHSAENVVLTGDFGEEPAKQNIIRMGRHGRRRRQINEG